MERGPLANDFAVGPRIRNLVRLNTGELVCGGITNAVAAGLVGVHFHFSEFCKNVGNVFQRRPVKLHILASGEVRIAFVVVPGDSRKPAKLV